MRVLFVLPYQSGRLEPLGIMYLAAALQQAGHQVRAALPNRASIRAVLQSFPASILAYSVITGYQKRYLDLNRWIREDLAATALSLFGGPHPTFFPDFINNDGVDAICIGEGEGALVDFTNRLERGEAYHQARNWWVKYEDQIYRNTLRPEIADLDTLPFPDRRLLNTSPPYASQKLRAFLASRGCPYNCSYCSNHAYRELYRQQGLVARARHRSVDNLIAEIQLVRGRHGMRSIAFYDDVFVTAGKWLKEFAWKYSEQIGLPFECNLRVEQVTRETVAALKLARCAIIALGIETADEEVRTTLLRRQHTNEQIAQACAIIHEHHIMVKTYNVLGLPPGDIGDDLQTLYFNASLRIDVPTASLYQPYPGTDLGESVAREGYWDGNLDSVFPGFYRESSLALRDKMKIELLQKLFFAGGRFPKVLPLIRLCLAFASIGWFRRLVFLMYRLYERISFPIGEAIVASGAMRRVAMRPTQPEDRGEATA